MIKILNFFLPSIPPGIPDCIEFNLDIKSIPADESGTPRKEKVQGEPGVRRPGVGLTLI